jgi:putative DNA primase/helicase
MNGAPEDQFRSALRERGIVPPDMLEPGRIKRADVEGKNGKGDASYIYFTDGVPAGGFENHKDGLGWQTWRADVGRKLTFIEADAQRQRIEAAMRQREADEVMRRAEAKERARALWRSAQPAPADHPYLQRKRVEVFGLRAHNGVLLVPMVDAAGELRSLQFIDGEGQKRYLTDGAKAGSYHAIGKPNGCLCLAEGYATAASIHQATGHAVAVAFDAGNLEPVARALRDKYRDLRIIVCADNDAATPSNPGVTKATTAARSVGGLLAVPQFGPDHPPGATDYNDLADPDAIRASIANATAPDAPTHQPELHNAPAAVLDGQTWPEPRRLPDLPPVAPFAFDLLPASLRGWARDVTELMQCPADFVAIPMMTGLGAVIGRKVGIRPQESTLWTEYPNQWALLIGRPGMLKSPAMSAALAPIRRLEDRAAEAYTATQEVYERDQSVAKMRAEAAKDEARKALRSNPNADVSSLLGQDAIDAPTLRRYRVNDTSCEALGEVLIENPNGVMVYRDELVSLLKGLAQEEQAGARGFYLTGWDAQQSYTFDRIQRGKNLRIPAVCLSMLGSTQPGRIAEFLRAAVRGGEGDDGLMQRFGLMAWPDACADWRDIDRVPDTEARREAERIFAALDEATPERFGAIASEFGDGHYLRFALDALGLFREWRDGLERKLRGELHPALESHFAKYRKLVPGLALICHLANGQTGPVSLVAVAQALAWAEYLETHANRAYASIAAPAATAAKAILAKICSADIPAEFEARRIYRSGWAGLADRDRVVDGLNLLEDYDWIASHEVPTPGRRATIYRVNPRAMQ